MAVQVARQARLLVCATCSTDKQDLVKSLGASEVFDYTKISMEDLSHDFDVVIDYVGGNTLKQSFNILKGGGKLISIARETTEDERAQRPDVHATFFIVEPDGEELTQIAQLCEQGVIKPVIQAVMPLAEGAKAFDLLARGHSRGKIVLKVDQNI